MAAALLLVALVAVVVWLCFTAPMVVFVLVVGAVALLVAALSLGGVYALIKWRLDKYRDEHGKPIPDPERDLHWTGAVTGGDTLSRRSLGEIRRRMALDSHRATTTAVLKSMRRHARRHGGAR